MQGHEGIQRERASPRLKAFAHVWPAVSSSSAERDDAVSVEDCFEARAGGFGLGSELRLHLQALLARRRTSG